MKAFLLALLLLSLNDNAWAQLTESDQLVEKYKEIKDDLVRDEEERRKVLSDLYKVTHNIKKIQRRRDDFVFERNRLAGRIKDAGEKIEILKSRLVSGRSQISDRLRAIYKFNGQGTLRLLFASQSMADLDRNSKMLKLILDRDVKIFDHHRKALRVFGLQKIQMKRDLSRFAKIEKEIELQEDALITQQATKSKILARFDEATLSRLKDLESIRTQSTAKGSGLVAAFFEKKGKLAAPVNGQLRQRFGTLKDNSNGVQLRYKGHFYEAPTGEPVRSIYSGEVVFSGRIDGYGPTIVISHGDHYYSVYGGMRRLDADEGEKVDAGEVIGASGNSYYLFSSGLYFEIRHFSDPVNPAEWLASNERQITFVQEDQ